MRTKLLLGVVMVMALLLSNAEAQKASGGGGLVGRIFRSISQKNGNSRVLHRPGALYEATLKLPPGSKLGSGTVKVIARVSRGTPAENTVLGLAVRVPNGKGGHDDLLMASSGTGWLMRRLPARAASFFARSFSSLLAFRTGGRRVVVRAFPTAAPIANRTGSDFQEVASLAEEGKASFRLEMENVWGKRSETLGELSLGRQLPQAESDSLKFNIWGNQTIRPAGVLNMIRQWAYKGSKSTR
jgi:hypothetical protein